MTSESPTENRDYFNFGRTTTPPPTTSSYVPNRIEYEDSGGTTSEAAALIEPKKEKATTTDTEKEEKDKDDKEEKDKEKDDNKDERAMGPGDNLGYDKTDCRIRDDDGDRRGDKGDKDGKSKDHNEKIPNGEFPSNFKTNNDGKNEEELDDDDTCFVKCLYYTMQCCECTIS